MPDLQSRVKPTQRQTLATLTLVQNLDQLDIEVEILACQLVVGIELDALGSNLAYGNGYRHATRPLQEQLHADLDLLEIGHLVGGEEE